MQDKTLPPYDDRFNDPNYPVRWGFLKFILITGGISFVSIVLSIIFLESNWDIRMNILKTLMLFGVPIILVFFSNTLYDVNLAHMQKLKDEKNTKIEEANHYLNLLSGKIKSLLVESIKEEWGDIEAFLATDSNVYRIYEYAKEKMEYQNNKQTLIHKIQNDITTSDIWAQDILEVYNSLLLYSKSLEKLTQSYIKSMPIDLDMALKIHNRPLFQEVLYEENIWVEHEAKEMQWILSTWIHHHLKEVAKKKLELKELLNKEHQALWDLIGVTHTMRQHAFFQVQSHIS